VPLMLIYWVTAFVL